MNGEAGGETHAKTSKDTCVRRLISLFRILKGIRTDTFSSLQIGGLRVQPFLSIVAPGPYLLGNS